jgi:TonB-linked SusC/RagA family outer membrane protein
MNPKCLLINYKNKDMKRSLKNCFHAAEVYAKFHPTKSLTAEGGELKNPRMKNDYPPCCKNSLCKRQILMIMKLSAVFLLIALQVSATNFGQKMINLKAQNVTVPEVLRMIEKVSDYSFYYSSDILPEGKLISVNAQRAGIGQVLREVFENTQLKWQEFEENKIVIVSDRNAVAVASVTGLVTDADGKPLAGVSIIEKGTANGTTTADDGRFSISVSDNATLVFSAVGYIQQEIRVTTTPAVLDVKLLPSPENVLNEVVVVGYGTQKKVNLTGAVDQVGSQYFENRPVPNISRALQGVIPNLNINFTNGRPTSNPAWNIRGLTSIGAGGEALILIDGVVGDPRNLNPEDVESVSVLKDAASAAIYGSRGAFGVILITTKDPGKSKTKVTYSGNYSWNKPVARPHVVTDGYTWAKMYKESYSSWYDYSQTPSSIGSSNLPFSDSYLDSLKYRSEHPGQLPEVSINPVNGNYVYYGNTDWYGELYAPNIPSMEHSLNVSGGTDKADFMVSGRIFNQEGIYRLRKDNYDKYDFRIKGGVQATDWLRFNASSNYSSYNYTDPFRFNVWQVINIFGNGTPLSVMFNPDGTLTQNFANTTGALLGGNLVRTRQNFNQNNAGLVASFLNKSLNIRGDFTYQNTSQEVDDKVVPISYSVKPGVITTTTSSQLSKTLNRWKYYSINVYGDYSRSFGAHNTKILIGQNFESSRYDRLGLSRDNLLIPQLDDFNLTVGDNRNISGGGDEWANNGIFSRINYDYKGKYLLELNGRYDGSSKFPRSKQYGFFPSVSAGWVISNESFMNNIDFLNHLKVRGSYGSLGNSQISPYLYLEQLRANISPVIIEGGKPSYISNPAALADNFTWETATTFNMGLDFSMLQYKLQGTFDWYRRNTYDMVTSGPILPAVFGASVPRGNYADLYTRGFEFTLAWKNSFGVKKPFRYNVKFTLADNVSFITKYNNPANLISPEPYTFITNYYVGQRVGDIWGYETEGLFTSADDIKNHADQSFVQVSSGNKVMPGDIKFKDLNGDGKINKGKQTLDDHGDWKVIGNNRPRYMYGITTNFDWNNFSLDAFFQGVGKRDWYFNTPEFWGQYSVWYATIPNHTLKDNWTLNGNDPNSYWPRYRGPMVYGDRELQPQTKYLQNVSYIRLKNITLAYSLPGRIVKKTGLSNAQFYVSGQNLWTYSPMFKRVKDIDVEAIDYESGARYNGSNYPVLKTFSVGLNIGL